MAAGRDGARPDRVILAHPSSSTNAAVHDLERALEAAGPDHVRLAADRASTPAWLAATDEPGGSGPVIVADPGGGWFTYSLLAAMAAPGKPRRSSGRLPARVRSAISRVSW